jgi:hypothetical protein
LNGLSEKFGESARTYTTTLEIAQVDDDEWVGVFNYGFDGKVRDFFIRESKYFINN